MAAIVDSVNLIKLVIANTINQNLIPVSAPAQIPGH